uniref:Papilin a, proteoglycan-like sulfated glycoprotein n=1 Tax=Echeneis naucrates TaxID=173247 RepID=A0A665W637_ECHNA
RTDGGHNCVGPEKSYRSCNIQDCPEGSKDFREEQCSQFDGTDFQGKRYKWLPYYGAENPCELNCMPRGENFYYRHRSTVVDGTPCHPGRRDICVEGVCKRLGCDNILESPQQEDPCLQCGGNGQACHRIQNSFSIRNLPTGYNQMFIIPVGATTISIRETVATRNYLAIKNLRGEYYLNGHWVIEFSRATPIAGTVLYYQRGAEGDNVPETIIGRGPTTEPLVVELISQEPNQGIEYEYYLPNGRAREGYYWSSGSWSACSRECGSGYQSRLVFCTIDNEAYPDYLCASLPRPQTNRTCNPHPCPQTRRPRARVFSWNTGEWNTCSVTCGGGSQIRSVQCVSHDASGPRVVDDAICAAYAEAPPTLQTCNMHQCAEYRVTRWSACSVTCGSGEQTREVTCVGSGGMRLAETSCSSLLRPAATQPCEMAACSGQIGWHVGEWGLCSTSCGSGSRERQVICSDQERNQYPVDQCSTQPKPSTVERCNMQPCYSPQVVPSIQDPRGHDNRHTSIQPYDSPTAFPLICHDMFTQATPSLPTENAVQCRTTTYGCCYDRTTPAAGPNGEGCPDPPNHTFSVFAAVERSICSLPRAAGSCSSWVSRYHYDVITSRCAQFWYGSCHGNNNNFMALEECQRACPSAGLRQQGPRPAGESTSVRTPSAGGSRPGGSAPGGPAGGDSSASFSSLPSSLFLFQPFLSFFPFPPFLLSFYLLLLSLKLGGVTIDKTDPSTVEALVGQTVVLPCRVSPPPSSTVIVEWRRDGIPLSTYRPLLLCAFNCLSHRGVVSSESHITPQRWSSPSVRKQPLSVHVKIPGWNRKWRNILLTQTAHDGTDGVFPLRFNIDRSSSSFLEIRAGQSVRLPCTIVPPSALQSVTIQWTKDGQNLSDSRFSQHSDGTLVLGALKSDDSGVYTCTASSHQQVEQRQLQLKVQADLRITTAPNNIQVPEGSTAQLPCVVSGDNINIGWSRNGVPVRPDGRNILVSSDGSLILNNVKPSDEGTYTCNAYTGIYSVSATALVKVIKDTQQGVDLPPECTDQPELANCELIVYARLCSNSYYSSFCCASCARHSQRNDRFRRLA